MATKPTIASVAVGQKVSATLWNAQVYNLGNFLQNKKPVCVLNPSAVQAMTASTYTAITFDTEVLDTDSQHSTVSLTSRVVIGNTLGWYRCYGAVPIAATAAGQRMIAAVQLNGVTRINGSDNSMGTGGSTIHTPSTMAYVQSTVSTDYVELMGWQNVGAVNTTVSASVRPIFIVEYVGDLA